MNQLFTLSITMTLNLPGKGDCGGRVEKCRRCGSLTGWRRCRLRYQCELWICLRSIDARDPSEAHVWFLDPAILLLVFATLFGIRQAWSICSAVALSISPLRGTQRPCSEEVLSVPLPGEEVRTQKSMDTRLPLPLSDTGRS